MEGGRGGNTSRRREEGDEIRAEEGRKGRKYEKKKGGMGVKTVRKRED